MSFGRSEGKVDLLYPTAIKSSSKNPPAIPNVYITSFLCICSVSLDIQHRFSELPLFWTAFLTNKWSGAALLLSVEAQICLEKEAFRGALGC